MSQRVNPFAKLTEVPVFQTKTKTEKPVAKEAIDRIAEENNFPSRQAPKTQAVPRRKRRVRRTGRNQQLNIKATNETIERFIKAADDRDVALGEMLKQLLDAVDRAGASR